ncbi:MAG: DUF5671 domain-containing protein [bacterium]|nr:DUF5671 domain-containing protein [bacterium]
MNTAKSSPKDVFLHLLAIIALYFSAGSFIALIFQYINLGYPDLVSSDGYYGLQSIYAVMRWSIASLIIIFPVYLFTTRALINSYNKEPDKRELRIRKWLVYFTLFVAALIIMGDLVALIFNLLNGELTVRFLLKILTILFVAGAVFGYYIYDLKNIKRDIAKYLVYGVIITVFISVVIGFFVVGSPTEERLRRYDDRRVQDLQFIQGEVLNYWLNKERLPTSLADIQDSIRGVVMPNDPATNEEYIYKIKDNENLIFVLCSDFDLPSLRDDEALKIYPDRLAGNWRHDSGMICFERVIDKDFYRPKSEIIPQIPAKL